MLGTQDRKIYNQKRRKIKNGNNFKEETKNS